MGEAEPSETPEAEIMVGRTKPAPVRVAELGEQTDPSLDTSPLGAALMARKAERQNDKTLQGSLPRPDGGCDSPGWETNFSRIREDSDTRQNNSSPQGTALMRKKMERQQNTEGKAMPRSGELERPQRPPKLSPGADQLQPPLPLQKPPPRAA